MGGKMSRDKGKRGERETVLAFKRKFPKLDIHRGWQARKGSDDPDLVGLPGLWVEVKTMARPNPYKALMQACKEVETDKWNCIDSRIVPLDMIAVAVTRGDRQMPIATVLLEDFLELLKRAGYPW